VPWLALDDEDYHFPRTAPVYLTNPNDLITDADVELIVGRLRAGSSSLGQNTLGSSGE
jgi:hypothetical protein